MDLVEIDLLAELRLLASQEGFLDISSLGGIKGTDFSNLMALVRGQFQKALFAWGEEEESPMELTLDLTESYPLGGS